MNLFEVCSSKVDYILFFPLLVVHGWHFSINSLCLLQYLLFAALTSSAYSLRMHVREMENNRTHYVCETMHTWDLAPYEVGPLVTSFSWSSHTISCHPVKRFQKRSRSFVAVKCRLCCGSPLQRSIPRSQACSCRPPHHRAWLFQVKKAERSQSAVTEVGQIEAHFRTEGVGSDKSVWGKEKRKWEKLYERQLLLFREWVSYSDKYKKPLQTKDYNDIKAAHFFILPLPYYADTRGRVLDFI